ncbi:MAG: hypothetical protein R2911_05680 [Caldilineaceae bacterium]
MEAARDAAYGEVVEVLSTGDAQNGKRRLGPGARSGRCAPWLSCGEKAAGCNRAMYARFLGRSFETPVAREMLGPRL